MSVEIIEGDALEVLRSLDAGSVHCCITSPPYFGLRDYGTGEWEGGEEGCDHLMPVSYKSSTLGASTGGRSEETHARSIGAQATPYARRCAKCSAIRTDKQLGLEPTPEAYVAKLVEVFREVKRVLRDDGTLWLNLGDSYHATSATGNSFTGGKHASIDPLNAAAMAEERNRRLKDMTGCKAKDLYGIPWMVAFALRADGWYLRSEIIWNKPNPMPESVTDRPTKAHEQVFLLSKSARYFYDANAIREAADYGFSEGGFRGGPGRYINNAGFENHANVGSHGTVSPGDGSGGRSKRSVWTVATAPYPDAHFATFPPKLIEPMVLAGCPRTTCGICGAPEERVVDRVQTKEGETYGSRMDRWGRDFTPAKAGGRSFQVPTRYNLSTSEARTLGWQPSCTHDDGAGGPPGVVLDPFAGSGTTLQVAMANGRSATGIELNPEYVELMRRRLVGVTPSMFDVSAA